MALSLSLRSRFITGFIVLALGPVLLLGALVSYQAYLGQLDALYAEQQSRADELAARLEAVLRTFPQELERFDDLIGIEAQPAEAQRRQMRTLLLRSQMFRELALVDADGFERVRTSLVRLVPEGGAANYAETRWFRHAHGRGLFYFGPVFFDNTNGEPLMQVAVPLRDLRGNGRNGVLLAVAQLRAMWELLNQRDSGEGHEVYILDEEWRLIAHRNPSLVLRGTLLGVLQGGPELQSGISGDRVVLAERQLVFGNRTFHVVAEQNADLAFTPVMSALHGAGFVLVLALALAGLLIALAVHHIIRPISRLQRAVQAMRNGDLERRIEVDHHDELGALAAALNQMAADLAERFDNLAASEARHRLLVENMNDLMIRFDRAGRLQYVSESYSRTMGRHPDELLGMRLLPLVQEADRKVTQEAIEALTKAPHTSTHVERALTVQGWRWFAWSSRALLDEHGQVRDVVSVGRDITELKLTEFQLRDEQERMRLLLDSTGDGVFGVDRAGICYFANATAVRLLGYAEAGELVGSSIHEVVHSGPRDNAAARSNLIGESMSLEQPMFHDEDIYWRKDGKGFPAATRIYPLRRDERVVGAVVTFSDTSEWRVLHERVRQAAILLENITEGVLITDNRARIIAINPAFSRITGYSEREAIGRKPSLLKSDRHPPEFYKDMWRALRSSGSWKGELWNRRKGGEVYAEWLHINAVYDDAGHATHYVGLFSDLSSLRQPHAQLDFIAHHDPLTSLPNRLLFHARLEHSLQLAHRQGSRVALLYLDLDGFEQINSSQGYPVGDKLLQLVAQRLGRLVGEGESVSRLGGDEFALFAVDGISRASAEGLAQQALDVFLESFILDGREIYLTSSVGIALYPDDADSLDELIQRADSAMYHAKHSGKNTFQCFSQELNSGAFARHHLESKLRHALEREEFVLYYQPQFDLRDGKVIGAEALLRWSVPELGLVKPLRFFPLAEALGLLGVIDEWTLRHAVAQAAQWYHEGLGLQRISVNVSPAQALEPAFVHLLHRVVSASDLPSRLLELELPERMMIDNNSATLAALEQLRRLGIQLALDNCGRLVETPERYEHLPVERIKVDGRFVRELGTEGAGVGVVKRMVQLARENGYGIIAEGVETELQRAQLLALGYQEGQGYLLGRPLEEAAFTRLLHAQRARRQAPLEGEGT